MVNKSYFQSAKSTKPEPTKPTEPTTKPESTTRPKPDPTAAATTEYSESNQLQC